MVFLDQILPPVKAPYPKQYEWTYETREGEKVLIRPIRPEDEPMMRDMFYSFSEKTVHLRFHSFVKAMPHQRLQVFCNVDYDSEMALIGISGAKGHEEVVAVGSYMADASLAEAEVAFTVRDDWQRKGLGTFLFGRLVEIARAKEIREFKALVLPENIGMLKVFHGSGLKTESSTEEGVVSVSMSLSDIGSGQGTAQ